jgi:hypothetical protein
MIIPWVGSGSSLIVACVHFQRQSSSVPRVRLGIQSRETRIQMSLIELLMVIYNIVLHDRKANLQRPLRLDRADVLGAVNNAPLMLALPTGCS